MSDSLQHYGLQTARLLSPWDSPGKNTEVVCHFLLQGILPSHKFEPTSLQFSSVTQLCLTLCDPMNGSTPGLPVHHHLLEFSIQKTKIMASSPITSWQIDGETVSDFILGGSKITADGDCSHEIKRRLLLGRKVMTNLWWWWWFSH